MRQSERWLIPFIKKNKYAKSLQLAEAAKSKTVHADIDKLDTYNYGSLFVDKYTVNNTNNKRKSIYRNPIMTRQSRELFMYIIDFMPIDTGCIVLQRDELAQILHISKGKVMESIKILEELDVLDRINHSPPIYSVNPKYAFRGELLKFLTDNFKRYLTVKQVKVVNGKWTVSYRPYVKLKNMYQIDLSKPIIEETDDLNN